MAEFEITERTEPFTLDEVFEFIDDTNIGKTDAHELKSRIADMVQAERNKAIDEVFDFLKTQRDKKSMKVNFDDLEIRKYKEQLKGGASRWRKMCDWAVIAWCELPAPYTEGENA